MKWSLLPLLIFLVAATAQAQTVISSLPYTVSVSNTTYILNSDLTTGDSAITIASGVHDVIINLQGHTITWGTNGRHYNSYYDGGRGATCFRLALTYLWASQPYNITIRNGILNHLPPADSLAANIMLSACAVNISRSRDVLIEDLNVTVRGGQAQVIWCNGGGPGDEENGTDSTQVFPYNITIRDNTFNNLGNQYWDRQYWDLISTVSISRNNWTTVLGGGGTFQYHIKYVNNINTMAPHCNLHIQGERLRAIVDSNYFLTDARNDKPYGGGGLGSATEAYPLSVRGGHSDVGCFVKVRHNTIRSGNNYSGGRAIFVAGVTGTSFHPDSCIRISNNDINIHGGFDKSFHMNIAVCIRQGWKYVVFDSNRVEVIGDTTGLGAPAYPDNYGSILHPLRLTGDVLSYQERGLKVYGNTFISHFRDSSRTAQNFGTSIGGVGAYGIVFDAFYWGGTKTPIPEVIIDSNFISTVGYHVTYANAINGGTMGATISRTTFQWYSPSGTVNAPSTGPHYTVTARYNKAINNVIRNPIFEDNIDPYRIYQQDGGDTDSLSFWYQATVNIEARSSNYTALRGVIIDIENNYGQTWTCTTRTDGISKINLNYYFACNTDYLPTVDSTNYTPLIINARCGDIKFPEHNLYLSWYSRYDMVTFAAPFAYEDDSASILVRLYPIDSSISRIYNGIGIPRQQILALPGQGDVVVRTGTAWRQDGIDTTIYVSFNLDSGTTWPSRWTVFGGDHSSSGSDHCHLSNSNDTVYINNPDADKITAMRVSTSGVTSLFTVAMPIPDAEWYAAPTFKLPSSDTVICASRGAGEPNANDLNYRLSSNKGVTFSAASYIANWSPVGSNVRIGGTYYDNSFAVAACSASSGVTWFDYNRATSAWVNKGHVWNYATFHAFAMNAYQDTVRWLACVNNNGSKYDSVLLAYRNKGAGAWTVLPPVYAGDRSVGAANHAYVAMSYLEASQRLVLFYTYYSGSGGTTNISLYMKYWKPETSSWSTGFLISKGHAAWKVVTSLRVPSAHGDMAYFTYPMDSALGSDMWHYGMVGKIVFGTGLPPDTINDGSVAADYDIDDDGVADSVDNCPNVANAGQADGDFDGVGDACDNCPDDINAGQEDDDLDGVGNICDHCPTDYDPLQPDTDLDDVGDTCDNCPSNFNDLQEDLDIDGAGDSCDNCLTIYNPTQTNIDTDSLGDECDNCDSIDNNLQEDADFDSRGDSCDNCPTTYNPNQLDTDSDGIGDACDNCVNVSNPTQTDTDNDGIGDACDSAPATPSQKRVRIRRM